MWNVESTPDCVLVFGGHCWTKKKKKKKKRGPFARIFKAIYISQMGLWCLFTLFLQNQRIRWNRLFFSFFANSKMAFVEIGLTTKKRNSKNILYLFCWICRQGCVIWCCAPDSWRTTYARACRPNAVRTHLQSKNRAHASDARVQVSTAQGKVSGKRC